MPRAVPNKQKLTSLTVTKLRPAAKPYLVWDSYQRGLALQIQPSGYRSFKLIYRHRNRPRWYHIGAADAIALADAGHIAAELMLEVIRGKDPATEKRAERDAGTFADLAQRYLEQHAKKRNRSWKQGDALIKRNALPRWGKLQADAITRADVKALMRSMDDAPMTANLTLANASAIFTWAVNEEILSVNPCRGVARNPTTSRERVLADGEVPLFWQAFCEAGLIGAALQVLLLTGQRPGEVAHMQHEQISDGASRMKADGRVRRTEPAIGCGYRRRCVRSLQNCTTMMGPASYSGNLQIGARPCGVFAASWMLNAPRRTT